MPHAHASVIDDRHQHVVKLVSRRADELAQRRHFLALLDLLLQSRVFLSQSGNFCLLAISQNKPSSERRNGGGKSKVIAHECDATLSFDCIGGIDLDNKLSLMTIMPHFGKNGLLTNGLPVPATFFTQAVRINDVSAQQDFSSNRTGSELERCCMMSTDEKLLRLKHLRDQKLGLRLSQSAEIAKISLSAQEQIDLPLAFIEEHFSVPIKRSELAEAIKDELKQFELLINESLRQADTQPEAIFVTGGTAISPVIQNWIHSMFPEIDVVIGNHFGSVTTGLVTHAQRVFT
jgi:hypothetical chaperone protein